MGTLCVEFDGFGDGIQAKPELPGCVCDGFWVVAHASLHKRVGLWCLVAVTEGLRGFYVAVLAGAGHG